MTVDIFGHSCSIKSLVFFLKIPLRKWFRSYPLTSANPEVSIEIKYYLDKMDTVAEIGPCLIIERSGFRIRRSKTHPFSFRYTLNEGKIVKIEAAIFEHASAALRAGIFIKLLMSNLCDVFFQYLIFPLIFNRKTLTLVHGASFVYAGQGHLVAGLNGKTSLSLKLREDPQYLFMGDEFAVINSNAMICLCPHVLSLNYKHLLLLNDIHPLAIFWTKIKTYFQQTIFKYPYAIFPHISRVPAKMKKLYLLLQVQITQVEVVKIDTAMAVELLQLQTNNQEDELISSRYSPFSLYRYGLLGLEKKDSLKYSAEKKNWLHDVIKNVECYKILIPLEFDCSDISAVIIKQNINNETPPTT